MNVDDLLPGDLVFFVSPFSGIVEHTSIFLGIKNDTPYIVHATMTPYNAIMVTHLKKDEDFVFKVIRPVNTELALEALAVLLLWVEYQVPYAKKDKVNALFSKIEKRCSLDLKSSENEQMNFGLENYAQNFYSYFDLANELPNITEYYREVGMGCAESVTAAYNVASIRLELSYNEEIDKWYCPVNPVAFALGLNNPLPFDSQHALSAGVHAYCSNSPSHWIDLGFLELTQTVNAVLDKNAWQQFKRELAERAQFLVDNFNGTQTTRVRTSTFSSSSGASPFEYTQLIEFASKQVMASSPVSPRFASDPLNTFFCASPRPSPLISSPHHFFAIKSDEEPLIVDEPKATLSRK